MIDIIKSTLKKTFNFFLKSYWIYSINPSKNNLKKQDSIPNFEFKMLEIEDFHYFLNIEEKKYNLALYKSYLENSFFKCTAMIDKNEDCLAYYGWMNFSKYFYIHEINRHIDLQDTNSCLFIDDYTLPRYRQRGLHKYVFNKRIEYCINMDIKEIYIVIHTQNKIAMKTAESFGFNKNNFLPFFWVKKPIKRILDNI